MKNTTKTSKEIIRTQEEAIDKMLIEKKSLESKLSSYLNKLDITSTGRKKLKKVMNGIKKIEKYIEYSHKIIDSHKASILAAGDDWDKF